MSEEITMEKIIMGIDASSTCTGWAIYENNKLIKYGCIKPKGRDWRERLSQEGPELVKIIELYNPNKIYMENVPLKKAGGLEILVILGAVQGYILGIASAHNIPMEFCQPTVWRSGVGLYDGSRDGTKRDILKEKAVTKANEMFNIDLVWNGPKSKKSEDDIAEAILIGYYGTIKEKRLE